MNWSTIGNFAKTKQVDSQARAGKRQHEDASNALSKKERLALTDLTNKGNDPRRTQAAKKEETNGKYTTKVFDKLLGKSTKTVVSSDKTAVARQTQDKDVCMTDCSWDSIPHVEIDVEDDPQLCSVYANDIYAYLRENELTYRVDDYMTRQTDLNAGMRGILIDWLVEVAEEYKLTSETLYLTASYLDRYLSKLTVNRGRLQLVGVACMLLASKYEEIYAPSVEEFVYISDSTYTKDEVFAMESQVLDTLGFCLSSATAKNFIRRFLKAADAEMPVTMLANYFCELSLREYTFVGYLPSTVAASALYLAMYTLDQNAHWHSTLEYYSRHRLIDTDMRACVKELHRLHKESNLGPLQAVQEKYSHSRFMHVSNHKVAPPAPALPF